jgi:hypothetical protein
MKIRKCFVSNSSSSSFIVGNTSELSEFQRKQIRKIKGWTIAETEEFIFGWTDMDHIDIERYLEVNGIHSHLRQVDTHIGWVQREFLRQMKDLVQTNDYDLK